MSNRALQGAYAIGVWKIVELAREVPSNSEYYIHGFDKLTPVVRKMSCIACLVSYVPEKVLGLINKEERIMKNIDDVDRALHEAIEYVVATLTSTWERLADMIAIPDYGWRDLAADTIASTHVCASRIPDVSCGGRRDLVALYHLGHSRCRARSRVHCSYEKSSPLFDIVHTRNQIVVAPSAHALQHTQGHCNETRTQACYSVRHSVLFARSRRFLSGAHQLNLGARAFGRARATWAHERNFATTRSAVSRLAR